MDILRRIRRRLSALFDPNADLALQDEIGFHIDLETDKNVALGMSPHEARRLAVAHFGGVQRVREEHRAVRRVQWAEDFAGDVRFAIRSLKRTGGLSAAAVITLALGIGANVAIFSAVNAVVLQPLPYQNSDRLVMITEENPEKHWHLNWAAPANYLDWRAGVPAFQDVMAYTDFAEHVTLTGTGDPTLLRVTAVTGNFFATLGVRAELGRTFVDAESWKSGAQVAIISDRVWRGRFGADRSIIGRSVKINGGVVQIVGVMPASFGYPTAANDLWQPIGFDKSDVGTESFRRAHWLRVVARLRPGATAAQADAQLQTVVATLKREYPGTNKNMGAAITPLHEFLVGNTRLPLLVLLTSVAFLLLIACANVGNLLLVQAAGRERESSLRLALGAGRFRLVRQALTESLVLSVVGGACGLALGFAGTRALVALQPAGMLRVHDFGVDHSVLIYVLIITMVSGLVFGAAPALWMRHRDPAESLKEGGRGAAHGRRTRRWGAALVVGEVGLALVMTVGAGLLVRSLLQMRSVDPGFDPHGVLTVRVGLGESYDSVSKITAFMDQLMERSNAIPGVSNVALASDLPLTNSYYTSDYTAAGRAADGYGTEVGHRTVSSGYFSAMRVPIIRGRGFSADDRLGGVDVIVINNALARSYFAGENPIGQRVAFEKVPTPTSTWYTIVGVVGDEHLDALDVAPKPEILRPASQEPMRSASLILRSTLDPVALAPSVRAIVHDLDPSLALYSVQTMDEVRAVSMAQARFITTLLLVFAVIGLTLSVVGVYGVLSQVSRNRTREMGIRIALGAQAGQVRWLVVRSGLQLTAAGLLIGAAVSLLATRAMSRLLFNVAPNDPLTLVVVATLLAVTSVVASWLPAVRASRADPATALRSD